MNYIKNRETILSHGNRRLRECVLDILDNGIFYADPYSKTRQLMHLAGDILTVGDREYDLRMHNHIYVVGAGKATFPIAKALEDILGDRIEDGVIICKYGQEGTLDKMKLRLASHPLPDQEGYEAAKEMMELAKKTQKGDIVIAAVTGGSTALMPCPPEGITIDEKRKAFQLLLRSSANIVEMNMVRKHMTRSKGGFLAKTIHPEASIINITVSDVIGDPLDYITCPTVADTSTFDDARAVLTKYGLWDKFPKSIADYIQNGNVENETPKDFSDRDIVSHIIVKGDSACIGAYEKARELGFNAMIVSTMFEGESKELGSMFASMGKEILHNNRPIPRPCIIIGGGEGTMKINIPNPGEGGPNQQFALAAATWLEDAPGVVISSIDTDGTDGVSKLAGGIVDCSTMKKAREIGLDIFQCMADFSDSVGLRALGDEIYTGATGTNVNDLKILAVE